jgi:hypothetical protein
MTGLEWTSVPRWCAADAVELPQAASYLAVWFGDQGRRHVAALLARADRGVPVRRAGFPGQWTSRTESELRRLVGGCFTGVRIVLAGPEVIVMRAMAIARELGASTEELMLLADEAGDLGAGERAIGSVIERRVYCAACRGVSRVTAAIGAAVTCRACGARLSVDRRFSRPHAAYYGWPAGLDLKR